VKLTCRTLAQSLLLALLLPGLLGCSLRRMALRTVEPVLDDFVDALFAEEDLELARGAFEADIKLIEGLRRTGDSPRLRVLNAMALTGYALIYCEGFDDERAGRLYLRARDIGQRMLGLDPFEMDESAFREWLAARRPVDLEGLFWTAFPYGAWINLNLHLSEALFRLPRVEDMVRTCIELDEGYFFGAGSLFLGALDCVRPRIVGGDPRRGREAFRRAQGLVGPALLLARLYEAKYYCPAALDEQRFDELLAEIRAFDSAAYPDHRLLNSYCLREVEGLAQRREELF